MLQSPARLTSKALTGLAILLTLVLATPAVSFASSARAKSAGSSNKTTSTTSHAGSATTVPNLATQGDLDLESVMLAVPLPGLTGFTLVGPGATNGVLTSETLASYSNNPSEVEHLFDQYSAESGFAGWIKTWQNQGASDVVVEIAIRFHSSTEAATNASSFVSTLSQGISGGTRTNISSIPGAIGFSIDESAITSGTTVVPAQQVQAVVFSDGDYFVALHTDSLTAKSDQQIAQGTATALALQQYQYLAPVVNPPHATKTAAVHHGSGGSSALIVGIVLLVAVALVILAFAFFSRRRRVRTAQPESRTRTDARPDTTPGASPKARAKAQAEAEAETRTERSSEPGAERSPASPRRHRPGPSRPRPRTVSPPANAGLGNGHADAVSKSDDAHLVAAAASKRSAPEQHLSASRSRHPSAVALANSRPPETAPGWYPDPTDDERRRIRFWDGAGWTAHVAEPQG
jgi:hypothetical protein